MKKIGLIAITSLIFIMFGCGNKTAPKPIAYPHIENTSNGYTPHRAETFPLQFDIANGTTTESNDKNNGWINIKYPQYNATIYCTYIKSNNLQQEIAKSRELVYVHSKHSSGISTLSYNDTTKNVSAELYAISGKVATPLQFIATDNTSYIFRGALYFNSQVNNDSVAPVVEYLKNDIIQIIETLNHK